MLERHVAMALAIKLLKTHNDIKKVKTIFWEVFVAQLVERLLLIPEVCSLNPVICKNLFILNICLLSITVNCVLKR